MTIKPPPPNSANLKKAMKLWTYGDKNRVAEIKINTKRGKEQIRIVLRFGNYAGKGVAAERLRRRQRAAVAEVLS